MSGEASPIEILPQTPGKPQFVHGEWICTAQLGQGRIGRLDAFAALSHFPGAWPGEFELVFALSLWKEDAEQRFFDGLETRRIVPFPHDRALILDVLCDLIALLVAEAAPDLLTFTTYRADLPERALRKYDCVLAALRKQGYVLTKVDRRFGCGIWWVERTT